MVKIFSQTHHYEDAWRTVTLAFFLRYPNRYASHVVSADVLSRTITPEGTLRTTRLILKRGALPAWFPRGLMHRAESWIVEESEVDVDGKVLTCRTRNLDHVKVMEVIETTTLKEDIDGTTIHKTEARFRSGLGWGLKRRIEEYSASKFKANIEKSRMGLALVVRLLREARLQSLPPPFGNRITQDGNQWSYSDIHAAAVSSTPPQSLLSITHPSTRSPGTSASQVTHESEGAEDQEYLRPHRSSSSSSEESAPTRRGWAGWLWPPKN